MFTWIRSFNQIENIEPFVFITYHAQRFSFVAELWSLLSVIYNDFFLHLIAFFSLFVSQFDVMYV